MKRTRSAILGIPEIHGIPEIPGIGFMRNCVNLILMFSALIWISGCSFAPKYTQPEASIPAGWPQGTAYKNIKTTPGINGSKVSSVSRQKFFKDEHLLKIINIALKNNLDLRLAALNVERVRALYGVQRAVLFPSINGVGYENKQRLPSDMSSSGKAVIEKQFNVNLGISSWEIDFFGRIRSLKEQALESFLATDQARVSARISLVSQTAVAYYTFAADRENLKLAGSTLDTQQKSYDMIKSQYRAGLANELDLRRAQTQVDSAKGKAARYTQKVAQDRNALNLLCGIYISQTLLPEDLSDVKVPEDFSAGLSSDVLLKRPDIIAAEHNLKGAYAFIGAARASFFPRIALTTGVGTASSELSGLFKSGSGTWNFAPEISVPVFDARTWAAYRVSKAQKKIALTQYEKAIQTAFREVADALAVQGTVDDQVAAQKSLVDSLAATYRLAVNRYSNGIDSYLSVLDAQRSLFDARQGLISLRLIKLANEVRLYAVLGGGGNRSITSDKSCEKY